MVEGAAASSVRMTEGVVLVLTGAVHVAEVVEGKNAESWAIAEASVHALGDLDRMVQPVVHKKAVSIRAA